MKFKFRSASVFDPERIPPIAKKFLKLMDSMPDGDVVDIRELASVLRVSKDGLANTIPPFTEYQHKVGQRKWYGNKKTIAELKKHYP